MSPEGKRSLAAVWFADVVGYTALSELDEDAALHLVGELQRMAHDEIEAHSGRIVKFIGDAVLAVFESGGDAVAAALAVRDAFHALPRVQDGDTGLRVGVHVGEIFSAQDGDVYGDGVNTAARLQSAAQPGQVLVSAFTAESIRHRPEFHVESLGEPAMKGLSRPLEVFVVTRAGGGDVVTASPRPGVTRKPARTGRGTGRLVRSLLGAVGLVAVVGGGAWVLTQATSRGGEGQAGTVPGEEPVLAILPFDDYSPGHDQAYFVDGLHEELLHQLATLRGFRLTSRTSTDHFRGSSATTSAIADSLGARFILEGSVRRTADSVQVTAQLIDGPTDVHLWSESVTRPLNLDALFDLQRVLATRIARSLGGTLGVGTGTLAAQAPTTSLEAYHAYLRGLHQASQFSMEGMESSLREFQRAVALDPHFGLAHARVALTLTILNNFGARVQGESFPEIREHAELAMKYAPDNPASHMAMTMIHWPQEWDWEAARGDLEAALALDPDYNEAKWMLAEWYGVIAGDTDRGLELIREAERMDPFSVTLPSVRAWILLIGHRYPEAVTEYRHIVTMAPEDPAAAIELAAVLPFAGRDEEARQLLAELLDRIPAPRPLNLAVALARAGMEDEARSIVTDALALKESGGGVAASALASAYATLGEKETALDWLERSFDEEGGIYYLRSPDWDPLRDEPRFQRIWERLGLPDRPLRV